MPEIPILQPLVLQGALNNMTPDEDLVLRNAVPTESNPAAYAAWDVEAPAGRSVGTLNGPNAEAKIVDRLRGGSIITSFATYREKKIFEPTTLWYARRFASLTDTERASEKLTKELANLKGRADRLAELLMWQALTGRLVYQDESAQIDIDYKYLPGHTPTVGTLWTDSTVKATQIQNDIRSFIVTVSRDSGVKPTDVYADSSLIDAIVNAFVAAGFNLLTDEMKTNYFATGTLNGLMGLNWHRQYNTYDPTASEYSGDIAWPSEQSAFLAPQKLIMGNWTQNQPMTLLEGPIADLDADQNFTGQFTKTWTEKDPSGLQLLIDWSFIPAITRPAQFLCATVG